MLRVIAGSFSAKTWSAFFGFLSLLGSINFNAINCKLFGFNSVILARFNNSINCLSQCYGITSVNSAILKSLQIGTKICQLFLN